MNSTIKHGTDPPPLPSVKGDRHHEDFEITHSNGTIKVSGTRATLEKLQKAISEEGFKYGKDSSKAAVVEDQALAFMQQTGLMPATHFVDDQELWGGTFRRVRRTVDPPFICDGDYALDVDRMMNVLRNIAKWDGKGRVFGLVVLTRRSVGSTFRSDPYSVDALSCEADKNSTHDLFFYREHTRVLTRLDKGLHERWSTMLPASFLSGSPTARTTLAPTMPTGTIPAA